MDKLLAATLIAVVCAAAGLGAFLGVIYLWTW